MITVFDTETTGFCDFNLPVEHPKQPRLVQIGAILCDDDFTRRGHIDLIVRPNGYVIPESASRVHGITQEIALRCGVEMIFAISMFAQFTTISHTLIAFNCEYDSRVLSGEFIRAGLPQSPFSDKHNWRDVMKEMMWECNLPPTRPGQTEPKYPKLSQAYAHYFQDPMPGAHSALNDCFATLKIAREYDKRRTPKETLL